MELTDYQELLVNRLMQMEEERYTPSPLEPRVVFLKRRKQALVKTMHRTLHQADQGYSLLKNLLSQDKTRDMSPFLIEATPTNDSSKPILLYKSFGWSDAILSTLYEQARRLSGEEAIQAYSFLTVISPLVPEFWIALAMAYETSSKPKEAADAQSIAIWLKGER